MKKIFLLLIIFLLSLTIVSCKKKGNKSEPTYSITFEENGGTYVSGEKVQTVKKASEIVTPVFEKTGYSLAGWTLNETLIESINEMNLTENITLKASWKANQYKIKLDLNDGEIDSSNIINVSYDSSFTLPTPTKENDQFVGWNYNGNLFKNETYVIANDITIKAVWYSELVKSSVEDEITYIEFGKYPQYHVSDNEIIEELVKLKNKNQSGYYEYNGKEYAKIKAESFNTIDGEFLDGTSFLHGQMYWFLVEPIKWRVLTQENGEILLISLNTLDSGIFSVDDEDVTINGELVHPNNYEHSSIRKWLNKTFFSKAFNDFEKEIIINKLIDNSINSVMKNEEGKNEYICNDTNDNVFILSYTEITTYLPNIADRTAKLTDYAVANEALFASNEGSEGNGYYILRSPSYENKEKINFVSSNGGIFDGFASDKSHSVRPSIVIKDN